MISTLSTPMKSSSSAATVQTSSPGHARRVTGGQDAPACPTNPLQSLAGTWTFAVDGFSFPPTRFLAAAGRFTASIGANNAGVPIGVMAILQSSSVDGSPVRQEIDPGRYALNADCSGGTLTFNTGSRPVQYDFVFTAGDNIIFVGSNNGDIVEGWARRLPQ